MVPFSDAYVSTTAAALLLALLVVGPGLFVLRLARVSRASPLETFVLAWALGVPITASLVLWCGPVSSHLGPVIALALALAGCALAIRDRDLSTLRARVRDDAPLLALLPLLLVALFPYLDYGTPVRDGFALHSFYDHLLHTASLFELDRGIPPAQMPYLAGEPWWPYHNGIDALGWLPFHYLHTDPFVVHDVVMRGGGWLIAGLGAGVVVRRLTHSAWAGALIVGVFFASVGVQRYLNFHLGANSPSVLALSCLPGLLLALAAHHVERSWRLAAIVGLSATGFFLAKASVLLMLAPGLLGAGLVLIRERRWRETLAATGAGLAVVLPGLLYLSSLSVARGPGISYGAFADWAWHQPDLLARFAARLPAVVRPPTAVLLWITGIGGLAWPLALLALWRVRRTDTRLCPWHGFAVGTTCGLLFLSLFVIDEGSRQLSAWNIAMHLQFPTRLLVLVGAGVGAAQLITRLPATLRRAGPYLLFLGLGGIAIPQLSHPPPFGAVLIPEDWLGAVRVLRDETPTDAVVATYASVWGGTYTSGISGRRVFVERPALMFATFASTAGRLADLEILFSSRDPTIVHALLRERGISYVIESDSRPLPLAPRRGLTAVYRSATITLWRVDGVDEAPADPAALARVRAQLTDRMRAILRVRTAESARDVAAATGFPQEALYEWDRRLSAQATIADDLLAAEPSVR